MPSASAVAAWALLTLVSADDPAQAAQQDLLRFDSPTPGAVTLSGRGRTQWQAGEQGAALRLTLAPGQPACRVTLRAPQGAWDVSAMELVVLEVANRGSAPAPCDVQLQPEGPGEPRCRLHTTFALQPGERAAATLHVIKRLPGEGDGRLVGMRGYPGGWFERWGLPPDRLTHVALTVDTRGAARPVVVDLISLRAERPGPDWRRAPDALLFPLIDRFGQFRHREWPGKTHSEEDLQRAKRREAEDLAAHPGPNDWDAYGGWAAGPQRKATGFFRVEQWKGKWWLVDPEGRLFWSHGLDCVRDSTGYTPITDREHYFAWLPAEHSPMAQLYRRGGWAPHGYYRNKGSYRTFNFTAANLMRKYGPAWREPFAAISHRRLRSWGFNTIANWSDPAIYLQRRTPYTATVNAGGRAIEGSTGYWGKFVDVYDPSFAESLRSAMEAQRRTTAGDPWCIGYFVGNELSWGDELSLALAALASPADQPAKREFVGDLRRKYGSVDRLNQAWGTGYASWNAVLDSREAPDRKRAREDLTAFYAKTAERYFQLCREAVKRIAPDNLYLGCRFAWANDLAVRAAAKYCDVVSFNRYADSVADFSLPEGVDKPVVIGEFHFGALDRGMLHTGLRPTASQRQRADAYRSYVRGALANRHLVGAHWFTYGDQATTGRGDGENYQIGFLDVCDTPYPEMRAASRDVGGRMYALRAGD